MVHVRESGVNYLHLSVCWVTGRYLKMWHLANIFTSFFMSNEPIHIGRLIKANSTAKAAKRNGLPTNFVSNAQTYITSSAAKASMPICFCASAKSFNTTSLRSTHNKFQMLKILRQIIENDSIVC